MTAPATVALAHRAVLAITGEDRHAFLQGLLTNDISKVTSEAAQWSALLTPQGKYLHDFFIVGGLLGEDPALLFDCEAARLDDLKTRLSRYKLRSKAALTPLPDLSVHAVFGPGALDALGLPETAGAARTLEDGSVAFVDPRLPAMGARILGKAPASLPSAMPEDYDRLRYGLGLPDGSRDIEIEKGLMLESGFEELGGVDFSKGCYVGQELTARTRYRGLIKKRLLTLEMASGSAPEPGSILKTAAGKEAGEMRSAVSLGEAGALGMGLIRLEALEEGTATLSAPDGSPVTVKMADWVTLQNAQ